MKFVKNFAVVLLSALLLLYAGGVHLGVHYCNNKVISTSFNWSLEECNGGQDGKSKTPLDGITKKNCCLSEFSFSKLSTFSKRNVLYGYLPNAVSSAYKFVQPITYPNVLIVNSFRPPPNKVPLHKRVMRFLI